MERLLPNNIEAECGVLGSLLIDPEAIPLVADWLHPEDFYRTAHRMIYEAMLTLYERNQPADFITLCELLEQRDQLDSVGGGSYVTSLINGVPTSGNIEYYAHIVVEKAGFRRLIHAAGRIAALGYNEIEDAQEQAEQLLFALQRHSTRSFTSLADVLMACMTDLEALQKREQELLGVPTGFRYLDAALGGGLQRSDLVILAARPGNGKTSLALTLAAHAALNEGKRIAFFSLEMSAKQLGIRLLAMQADQDQRRLRLGLIDEWDEVVLASDRLAERAIWIDETAGISHTTLRSKVRRLQAAQGVDLVIVDYLQLMHAVQGDGKRFSIREQEIAEISRNLKAVAKELNVPVLALAQLSRAVESRQNKRPQLSDLRESGALENDADVVLFIYREDLYQEPDNPEMRNAAEIIIAKHRNGPTGQVLLRFDPSRTRFADVEVTPGEWEGEQ
ncbi:MAG TPA: replicative DNA helicase [Ktedonobacteraceae bacterium]|nr:replicative DNA helicase [Ktedonobacteraceae bacterium]